MEWERLTGVTGAGGPGSGYVVAPRLVLTSAHVVGEHGATVVVFRPGRAGRFMGRVVWCGIPGGRNDAALVVIEDPEWTPVAGASARWGKSVTHRPGLRCECWGVPDVMQGSGRPVETGQLAGTLNPGDGIVGDRYSVRLDGYPPVTSEDGRSPWGGLSGAAVFCDDLLVGVVAADPAPFRHSVLEAVPAYVLHHDPEFRAVLLAYASAAVMEAAELTKLISPEPIPHSERAAVSPAELLTARRAVVGFRGRVEVLEQLRAWAQQPDVGICLVHGPGGQGKTRLARRFGELFTQDIAGGIVLWVDRTAPPEELAVIADIVVPALVVFDYAETSPSQLTTLLTALATRRRSPPVKILALARTAGDWWDQLADSSDAVATLLDAALVIALPVLDATDATRQDSYRAAAAAFAEELSRLPEYVATDWPAQVAALVDRPLPSTTAVWTVLAIQMTALADLLDAATGLGWAGDDQLDATTSGRSVAHVKSPEERVFRHERRYWSSTAKVAGISPALSMSTLTDVVAATVLLLPPTPVQTNEWFTRIPGLSDQPLDRRDRVRMWLASLYPAVGPYAFGQLEPDRLAEHLIGTLIADQVRTSIVETLGNHVDGEAAVRWVSVCARAATHAGFGDPVGELLTRMLGKHPTTVGAAALTVAPGLEAPKPLVNAMDSLVRNPTTSTASRTRLADTMPRSSLLWANTAAILFTELVGRSRPEAPDKSFVRGEPLPDPLGADRIQFANEATGIMNIAAESNGLHIEWSRSDLAENLASLAAWLAATGRSEEAIAASAQAVQMFRRLAESSGSRKSLPRDQDAGEED